MKRRESEDVDALLFAEATKGVKPVEREHLHPARRAPMAPPPAPAPRPTVEDDGVSEYLADGQQQIVLRRLRRTRIPEADQLDLHGATLATFESTLRAFIQTRQTSEQHAILVIHGQGHRSPNRLAVLKQKVRIWLKSCGLVLAFLSEGPGALRVLLKRNAR
jgi:DNA-nicking Smr family endonuclease